MYKDLHVTFEESVEDFFLWVEEICGVSPMDDTYTTLKMLIKNENDLHLYIEEYYDGNIDDLMFSAHQMMIKTA